MAVYPCQHCDQRISGNAENVYLTLYRGDLRAQLRLIVHRDCASDLAQEFLTKGLHKTLSGDWEWPQDGLELDELFLEGSAGGNARYGR